MKGITALDWAYNYGFVDNSMVSQQLINYCLKKGYLTNSEVKLGKNYWITEKGLKILKVNKT